MRKKTNGDFPKDFQYYKFCLYGFLKNQKFFEPFLILFFLEKGLSYTEIGALYAVRELGTNFLEIPTGVLADSLGRRRTMAGSFMAYILSFLIFYWSQEKIFLYAAMMVFSLGEAFRTGTHKAMIFSYLRIKNWEDWKTHYYGHTRSWSQFGSALSSLLALGIVLYSGNYQSIFLWCTLPYIGGFFLVLSYPSVLDGPRRSFSLNNILCSFKDIVRETFLSLKKPLLRQLAGNVSIFSGLFRAVKDYLQPVLQSLALSIPLFLSMRGERRSAILIAAVYFFIFLMTSLAARFSGRFSELFRSLFFPLNATFFMGSVLCFFTGFLFFRGHFFFAAVFLILLYFIENLRKPLGLAGFSEQLDEKILATALSVQSQIVSLSAAFFALMIGMISDVLGIGGGIMVGAMGSLLLLPFFFLKAE